MDIKWQQRVNKRSLQRDILSKITQPTLITLGGGDIVSYVKLIPSCVNEIISYEKERDPYLSQLVALQKINRNIKIIYGDIEDAPLYADGFYDLDFMCGIPKCSHILSKFRSVAFSVTISHRPYPLEATPAMFAKAIGEPLVKYKTGEYIRTTKNSYQWHIYKDGMVMSTIVKPHY